MKMTTNLTGPKASGEKPLENLIRDALAYDSVKYKEALGINSKLKNGQPNGVKKSQDFEKMRQVSNN